MCSNFLIPEKMVVHRKLRAGLNGHSMCGNRPLCLHKGIITPIIKRKTDIELNLLAINFPYFLVSSLIFLAFSY
jgi:hypothetical protein